MKELTRKQREILDFIIAFRFAKGYSPSYKEIADCIGGNTTNASNHVHAMVRKGVLNQTPKVSRSIVPVDEEEDPYFKTLSDCLQEGLICIDNEKGGSGVAFDLTPNGIAHIAKILKRREAEREEANP